MKSQSSWQTTVFLALLGILAIVGLNSFVIINPGEAGVLSILGKATDGALLEGVHFKPPLVSKVYIYDVTVQKFEVPAQSSTKDLQQLTASFAINFSLDFQNHRAADSRILQSGGSKTHRRRSHYQARGAKARL